MRLKRLFLYGLIAAVSLGNAASSADTADQVAVNKSKRELLLLRNGKVLRSYKVALAETPSGQNSIRAMAKLRRGLTQSADGTLPARTTGR